MKKYQIVANDGENLHYSKTYETREEAERVAEIIRKEFPHEWESVEVVEW